MADCEEPRDIERVALVFYLEIVRRRVCDNQLSEITTLRPEI